MKRRKFFKTVIIINSNVGDVKKNLVIKASDAIYSINQFIFYQKTFPIFLLSSYQQFHSVKFSFTIFLISFPLQLFCRAFIYHLFLKVFLVRISSRKWVSQEFLQVSATCWGYHVYVGKISGNLQYQSRRDIDPPPPHPPMYSYLIRNFCIRLKRRFHLLERTFS